MDHFNELTKSAAGRRVLKVQVFQLAVKKKNLKRKFFK